MQLTPIIVNMMRYIKTGIMLCVFLIFSLDIYSQTSNLRIDSLRKVTKQKGLSETLLIQTWVNLSTEMVKIKHPESLEVLTDLRKLGQKSNSEYALGHYNLHSASFYYFNQNINTALSFAEKAIFIFEKKNYKNDLIDAYNIEGLIYQNYQAWTQSLQSYQKALVLCRELKDVNRQYTIMSNIALIYQNNKDYLKAIEYYKQSEKYYSKVKKNLSLANISNNMGICYKELKQPKLAEKYYISAIDNIKKIGNPYYESIFIGQLSDFYIKQKEYIKAIKYLKEAESIITQNKLTELEPYLYEGYGEYYLSINDYTQSAFYLQKANQLAPNTEDLQFDLEVKQLLFRLKKAQGNLSEAIEYYQKYSQLKDSLYNTDKANQLARWDAFYSIETKEKENQSLKAEKAKQKLLIRNQWITNLAVGVISILLLIILTIIFRAYQISKGLSKNLTQKNQEITQTNHQLAQVNQVKNKLFSIIAHDLRGPIGSLNQVLKLLKEDRLSIDDFKNILNTLQTQSENTEDLVENLLFWARNQMEGIQPKPKEINLENITLEVFELYRATAAQKDIDLHLQSTSLIQVYADPEMLKLVIRNLINNAIKYSHKDSQIIVKLENDMSADMVIMSIKDDGIGIPVELKEHLFSVDIQSRRGTNQEKGTGLGLMLVKDFVEAMGGELSVQSEVNQGSSFYISLPTSAISLKK